MYLSVSLSLSLSLSLDRGAAHYEEDCDPRRLSSGLGPAGTGLYWRPRVLECRPTTRPRPRLQTHRRPDRDWTQRRLAARKVP